MKRYDHDEPGFLCRNAYKRPGDKVPDLTGRITVDGVDRVLKAWRRRDQQGNEFLALRLKPASPEKPLTPAEKAVQAGTSWPCPLCAETTNRDCALCQGTEKFDPRILVEARKVREARQCSGQDAAESLKMNPQRFYEMETGRDLSPSSYGGPERRRKVAAILVVYLVHLGLLKGAAS